MLKYLKTSFTEFAYNPTKLEVEYMYSLLTDKYGNLPKTKFFPRLI